MYGDEISFSEDSSCSLLFIYDGGGSIGQQQREIFHFAFLGFHKRRDKKNCVALERKREKGVFKKYTLGRHF